jgi:hypothetical protein
VVGRRRRSAAHRRWRIFRTALAVRAISLYAPPAGQRAKARAGRRARGSPPPGRSQPKIGTMQLLGLFWAAPVRPIAPSRESHPREAAA